MDTRQKKRRPAMKAASRATASAAPVRKPKRKKTPVRNRKPQVPVRPTPDVVYTPAQPFNRNRFVLRLATVVAVVMALMFGLSIFFKVEVITVSGADKYDVWTVKEASGIEIGDNLLSFGKAKACGKITAALPYVESVRIGIKLPDTVNIEIKELDVAYSVKDSAGNWWLMTAEGRIVGNVNGATAGDYTNVLGVALDLPIAGQQAVAYEEPTGTEGTDTGAVPESVVRASDRLKVALEILQYLEERGIIGEAASVNVADLGNIELWYGQRFRVKLGNNTNLAYKIECMDAAINGDNGLKEYDSGILDISFTIKENQVIYDTFK